MKTFFLTGVIYFFFFEALRLKKIEMLLWEGFKRVIQLKVKGFQSKAFRNCFSFLQLKRLLIYLSFPIQSFTMQRKKYRVIDDKPMLTIVNRGNNAFHGNEGY